MIGPVLTPELVVSAYCQGFFPMARHRHGQIDWYCPDPRAIIPLDAFHVPKNLRKRVRRGDYLVTADHAFEQVIRMCAEPRSYQRQTWINDEIIAVYSRLNAMGITHSLEAWQHVDGIDATREIVRHLDTADDDQANALISIDDWRLVGGLYGVALRGAFFGESMFSRATDASKVCLVYLVERLKARDFVLLDTQISNPHTEQFGAIEISQDAYEEMLAEALERETSF